MNSPEWIIDESSDGEESKSEEKKSWRGFSMSEIFRNFDPWELPHVPTVRFSDNHCVLYHCPIKDRTRPPKPLKGPSKWDAFHLRLPSSTKNQYPVTQADGSFVVENRWELVEKALLRPIKNSHEFEKAVLSYNTKYQTTWKFTALHYLFENDMREEETEIFFKTLLPQIIRLALCLPQIVQTAVPLLKQGQNRSISLSQQQIACLLANAFLCTYPRRNTMKSKSEYSTFPDINFNRLFQSSGQPVVEKLKCILHYFRRVCSHTPCGVVTFTRRYIPESDLPKWWECNFPVGATPLHITSAGTIEDQGQGLLQVDFANKFLGGGVLGSGCVQEEIRFVICPELIVSKLFTEALRPFEALVMVGCEQYSKYTGYASTFRWDGDFLDQTPPDDSSRRQCHIVAIDALHFSYRPHQYREDLMLRELNKAYVGFYHPLDTAPPGIASGNWGCGAFGGEASLKALLQLMVCTVTKRPLVYFTFGDKELRDAVHNLQKFFIEKNITVRQLWSYLKEFRTHQLPSKQLYSFIRQIHDQKMNPKTSENSNSKMNNPTETLTAPTSSALAAVTLSPKKISPNPVINFYSGSKEASLPKQSTHSVNSTPERRTSAVSNSNSAIISSPDMFDLIDSSWKYEIREDPAGSSTTSPTKEATDNQTSLQKYESNPTEKNLDRKQPEMRQRTLVEMLDTFYRENPAKRPCNNTPGTQKNTAAKK